MQLAVIILLAYLVGALSTGLVTVRLARRQQREHDLLIANLQGQLRLQEYLGIQRSAPHRIPPGFPGPAVPPPYW
jgi:hypothetical protein